MLPVIDFVSGVIWLGLYNSAMSVSVAAVRKESGILENLGKEESFLLFQHGLFLATEHVWRSRRLELANDSTWPDDKRQTRKNKHVFDLKTLGVPMWSDFFLLLVGRKELIANCGGRCVDSLRVVACRKVLIDDR